MLDSEKIKKFATNFTKCVDKGTIVENGETFTFNLISTCEVSEFENSLFELYNFNNYSGKYEIKINSPKIDNLKVFKESQDFFKSYNKFDFDSCIILILNHKNKFLIKESNSNYSTENSVLFNYNNYRNLINILVNNPIFATLTNKIDYKIVILSQERGPYTIGYNLNETRIEDLEDFTSQIDNLKNAFQRKEFVQFFKETIINSGIHQYPEKQRLFEIVKHLELLINLSEFDFDNYVLNFSFEKVRAKFKEERTKYFESIDKNIDSLNKQVISFPLTFAATAFAGFQVKDKPLILLLVFCAYGLYTYLAFKILNITKYNVDCLKQDVINEEAAIKKDFTKNASQFEDDFKKINNKITSLKELVNTLKKILYGLLISFLIFSVYQSMSFFCHKSKIEEKTITIPVNQISTITIDTSKNVLKDSVKTFNIIKKDTLTSRIKKNKVVTAH